MASKWRNNVAAHGENNAIKWRHQHRSANVENGAVASWRHLRWRRKRNAIGVIASSSMAAGE